MTFFAAAGTAGFHGPHCHHEGPPAVEREEQGWKTAHRSKGAAVAPKIVGLCHLGPSGPKSASMHSNWELFGQRSPLAEPFFVFSRWMELPHQVVTCGPPRELHSREGD